MSVHPFPRIPKLDAMLAKMEQGKRIRQGRLRAAQVEYERQGRSSYHARRKALLDMAAKSRAMVNLADSVRAAALDDLIAVQNELTEMRGRYYAPEPEICWADRIDFSDMREAWWRK
jgi:hypothetical protein